MISENIKKFEEKISAGSSPWDILEEYSPKDNILRDPKIIFHGISGYDITRVESILEHGILTARDASRLGDQVSRNSVGYNGDNKVSVAESPLVSNTYTRGAYGSYLQNGIGFALKSVNSIPDNPKGGYGGSGIPGERYVSHSISTDNIVGVTVPEEMLDIDLASLPIGIQKGGYGLVKEKALALLDKVNSGQDDRDRANALLHRFDTVSNNHDMDYFERGRSLRSVMAELDSLLGSAMAKYYKEILNNSPTLRNILKQTLPTDMKVYDPGTGEKLIL